MSANHVHLINPLAIQHFDEFDYSAKYSIVSVDPLLITNDDIVQVVFNTTNPQGGDWIGAYSPPDVDVFSTSPVKFGYCGSPSSSSYLTTGQGQLAFNLTNLRSGVRFYYFTNGSEIAQVVANSSKIVQFQNINQPLRNRVVPTGDPNVFTLLWSSATSLQPTLKWGTQPGKYMFTINATTQTLTKDSMCGGVAKGFGYRDLGLIHTAQFTGMVTMKLSNTNISYVFGDAATDDFSDEFQLFVPPLAGMQPLNRPTTVALFADLGVGSSDNSYDTTVWREQCPPAINTTNSIADLVLRGEIDMAFHSGDISYANGYLSGWDFFLDMVSPIAGRVPYLTTVGNHESDWPGTPSNPGYGDASGGECGVCALALIPMPAPATVNQPWWSYDVGLIHFIGISTEHNFSTGSPQYLWLENDLRRTNRTLTPWVVFSGHRPMYVDSDYCCEAYITEAACAAAGVSCEPGTDVTVMVELQQSIEPLLRLYRVNLAFAGHYHNVQRQSAVYQNQVVQRAVRGKDSAGNPLFIHDSPNATVWMVIGSAGNGPLDTTMVYDWSEVYWNNMFGYALVTATNSTHLNWQFINSANNVVMDRVLITQDFSPWVVAPAPPVVPVGGGNKHATGWNALSSSAQSGVISVVVIVGGFLICSVVYVLIRMFGTGTSTTKTEGADKATTKSPLQVEFKNIV